MALMVRVHATDETLRGMAEEVLPTWEANLSDAAQKVNERKLARWLTRSARSMAAVIRYIERGRALR